MNFPAPLFRGSLVIAAMLSVSASANNSTTRPYLTLTAAEAGIAACRSLAEENGWRVAIAVKDRGGNLVAFMRMDDVFVRQADLATLKAETASTTPASTATLGRLARKPQSALAGIELVPGITVVEGGEPIKTAEGYAIGGVGVSGAAPSEDGQCARVAATAVAEALSALQDSENNG